MATSLSVALSDNQGDRLSALFEAHHDRLYRLARRLTPSVEDARDLVQETFLRAARRSSSIPSELPAEEAWLVRVLVNIRRDQWRRTAVRKRHDLAEDHGSGVDRGQEAALVARAAVWAALDILRPRRRAAVIMHELEGLAIPEITALLGISAVTVRWHLSMGRRDLARILRSSTGDSHEQQRL